MKKQMIGLMLCAGLSVFAEDVPADRVADWISDTEQAMMEAAKYEVPILLLYTAPSWCGYCKKLDSQLLSQDAFKTYANQNLVLLIADYSDPDEGAQWGEKNKALLEACPIQGYPHMYLLSPTGKNLGSVQFYEPEWSIQDYLDKIDKLNAEAPVSSGELHYAVEEYDPERDPAQDLKDAMEVASRENRHILLQAGGSWCSWCTAISQYFHNSIAVRSCLSENYLIMKVNVSNENMNKEFLSDYPPTQGYPHLYVLDGSGTLLHSQPTGPLEDGDSSYDEAAMLEFLEKWVPSKPAE